MVKDPQGEKEIKPLSKASSVTTKSFIDDVHDRSKNEKDTEAKISVKNALYERGMCITFYL